MENVSDNFLWRIILGVAFVIAIAMAIFAWFSYGEVTTEPLMPPPQKHNSAAFSIDELRGVISFYQKKEEDFRLLHSSLLSAPFLGKGGGVSVSVGSGQIPDQTSN